MRFNIFVMPSSKSVSLEPSYFHLIGNGSLCQETTEVAKPMTSWELWCEYSPFPVLWLPSLIAQLVKNQLSMLETPVQFLCQEDPLEKGYATYFSILGLPLWLSW